MSEKLDAPTSSSTETSSAPNGTGPKAVIKNVDMSEEMQQEAVDIATVALEKYNIEKDIAAQIKKEFDRRHGPTWHVVVGKNFGSYVTHGEWPVFDLHGRNIDACGTCVGIVSDCVLRFFTRRNEAFHLFLHWLACHSHLEVVRPPSRGYVFAYPQTNESHQPHPSRSA